MLQWIRPSLGKPQTFSNAAGVCFYQRESLPGYSAIFRHPNDELNFCYYLIPCGKDGMCGDVSVSADRPCMGLSHALTDIAAMP